MHLCTLVEIIQFVTNEALFSTFIYAPGKKLKCKETD